MGLSWRGKVARKPVVVAKPWALPNFCFLIYHDINRHTSSFSHLFSFTVDQYPLKMWDKINHELLKILLPIIVTDAKVSSKSIQLLSVCLDMIEWEIMGKQMIHQDSSIQLNFACVLHLGLSGGEWLALEEIIKNRTLILNCYFHFVYISYINNKRQMKSKG